MAIDWNPLKQIIAENHRFVLSSHKKPDADAVGSELAMANMLESLGKEVLIVNPTGTPANLSFLASPDRVFKLGVGVTEQQVLDNDVHIVLDTSAWDQLLTVGPVFRKSAATKVVIDHHVSSDDLGAIEFKDTSADATGTILHRMATALHLPISKETADALFCAIATDTGWYRFPSITSDTMRIAGHLMDCGVEPHVLYGQLYEQGTAAKLHLAGRILGRVRTQCGGRMAFTTAESRDFEATGAVRADTEGLVNKCMTIAGVQAAFIAVEQQNGEVKVSFRSRPGVDVSQLAEHFGGGGHRQAAGATLTDPLRVATSKILSAFEELLRVESDSEDPDD